MRIYSNIRYLNAKKAAVIFSGLLVLLLVIGSSIAMADTGFSASNKAPVTAPVNPDFVKHQQEKISNQPEAPLDGHKTGFIPPTVDLSHLSSIPSIKVSYPAYYDLRTLNKVTSVKDQGNAGTCWTFATYGSLESYLMPGENRDFSENNLKNLLSSAYPEGFDRNANDGGNNFMSTAYLARWSGPVDEKDDPYDPNSDVSPQNPSLQKHVQNVLFLPNRQGSMDNDEIKWAIKNYGALYTTLYYDDTCYSPNTTSYYYNGTSVINHAVAIVGWDDSFDKNKFSKVPPGNGAFIVKNSWNSSWGENGYFYVSYYDSKIGSYNSVFMAENTNNYKNIYQYDPLGWIGDTGYGTPTCWCANMFTAKSNDVLKAVSFYTTDSNCNYNIYVYTDPSSGPINQTGPILTKNGTSSLAGYHTVPLDSGVQLKAGQKFSVVLKLTTSGYGYPIAIEMPYSGYSSKATANAGESFISYDGNTWSDITQYFVNTNVCIKAFTNTGSVSPIANFTSNVTSGPVPLNVSFTDKSTGSPIAWKWTFGDGTNSTIQNPIHNYSKAGNYTVALTVSNAAGNNTTTKTNYIKVTAITTKPVANFTSNVTSGKAPLNVSFTDKSTGSPTAWKWTFGDGTNSTIKNPTHKYSKAGNYTIALTVTNAAGSNTMTKANYIKVTAVPKPVANFTSNVTSGNAPLNVAFTDKSTGTPTTWKWTFGDGTNSTVKNPTHKYSAKGNYTVALTATNAAGSNTTTKANYIKVK